MALDWVAPVATGTTATIVGGAGMFFTWLTGKQARDDARATAREARQLQRLENTYVGLLDMAERAGQWVQTVLPIVDTNPPQKIPDLPSIEEQAHTEALVKAFGSTEVRERMEVWRDVVKEMIATVGLIRWIEADTTAHRGIQENPRGKLDGLRRQEREARQALGNQVAVELRHQT
jgi:hypothetical protein